ncbi:MAG: TrmB family transcriptional regulator [Candidatus Aenigmatarchaeota archaeon]
MEKLKELGLSPNEIKIFQTLLREQRLSAPDIAKRSKIPPTKIYPVLRRMMRKGIIESVEIGKENKIFIYSLINPAVLTERWLKEKEEEISSITSTLQRAMRIYQENVPIEIKSWALDYAQRFNKFKEAARRTKKEALLIEKDISHFHLFLDLIRRNIKTKLIITESDYKQARKMLGKKVKIVSVPDDTFNNLPTFCILDKKYSFIFTERQYLGIYSEDKKIINMLLILFKQLENKKLIKF